MYICLSFSTQILLQPQIRKKWRCIWKKFSDYFIFFSFFEPLPKSDHQFGIRHFSGRVVYDANNFLPSNRDHLPDDIMWVLSKQNCNFGFATHLFNQEIKQPRGILFISYRMLIQMHDLYTVFRCVNLWF